MTQFFATRDFSLRAASTPTKVLLTCFLLTVSAAVALGIVNYRVRTGLSAGGAVLWYRGTPGGSGPLFEKTPLELLDATHPHLFGQAFLFFVLCHLFALTPVRPRLKLSVYVAAFASVMVDAASPWLIRYISPLFGPLQVAGTVVLAATFVVLVAVPLRELWFAPAASRQRATRRRRSGREAS